MSSEGNLICLGCGNAPKEADSLFGVSKWELSKALWKKWSCERGGLDEPNNCFSFLVF